MKFKKWISATATAILLATSLSTTPIASAEEKKTIADESIYDLLVDRFFNKTNENDYDADVKDESQFSGGDFLGLIDKVDFIGDMGFTIVSIGSVFDTEKYDGSMVTSYSAIERNFGTTKEMDKVIQTYKDRDMRIMVDFPLNRVSANHEWAQDPAKQNWIAETTAEGQILWDYTNKDVQKAVKKAIVDFVEKHKVGGLRLTNLETVDTAYLNELIDAVKEVNSDTYIISNEESDANFDATFSDETNAIYRDVFKNVDRDSSKAEEPYAAYLNNQGKPAQLMIDNLDTARFTFDSATENMFPPTRIRMALGAMFVLPGVPVVQYGTEIAMNGEKKPDTHQLYNFKTETDLIEYVQDLQMLRNKSETLRQGDLEIVKNKDGLLVVRRTSDEESWVIMINNTSKTQKVELSAEELGKGKKLKGLFEDDMIRENKDGNYVAVLDREIVEFYQVIDDKGINKSYLIALALVYILFIGFIYALIRRGRAKKGSEE